MIATRAQKSAMATLLNMKKKYNSFYLTRPLLLGEAPHPLLNPPLLRRWGLKAWPAGPVLANKLSPLRGCSWLSTQQSCECLCAMGAHADWWWVINDYGLMTNDWFYVVSDMSRWHLLWPYNKRRKARLTDEDFFKQSFNCLYSSSAILPLYVTSHCPLLINTSNLTRSKKDMR